MKLAMACVAALSLMACADEPTSNGGQNMVGVRPAKPSIDNPTGADTPANPPIFEGMQSKVGYRFHNIGDGVYAETIKPQGPIPGVCEQDPCEVVAIHYVDNDHTGLENVDLVSTEGALLCHIQLNDTGDVVSSSCGWYR